MTILRAPLSPRDRSEEHRVASALELFFDLCFVVAVSQAAGRLRGSYPAGHLEVNLVNYAFVFFAIWWAWMNFTWFASAYDNDDVRFRLLTAMQIAGVLILAAGVPRAYDNRDPGIMILGYVVMRLALGSQWLRVARNDRPRRITALRYGGGQLVLMVFWATTLLVPDHLYMPYVAVLVIAELAVPAWAEMAGATTWHPHHISERYSLFFLIVLGESVLATTVALQTALDGDAHLKPLLGVMIGGFVTVFSMWWLYFFRPGHEFLVQGKVAFLWGYGHYFIFAATAAVGAGLSAAVDQITDRGGAHYPGDVATHFELAVPIAVFLLGLWALHWGDADKRGWRWYQLPITAGLVLLAALTGIAYWLIAALMALTVTIKVRTSVSAS